MGQMKRLDLLWVLKYDGVEFSSTLRIRTKTRTCGLVSTKFHIIQGTSLAMQQLYDYHSLWD